MVLHRDSGRIEHRRFHEIGELLNRGDLLVMNDALVTARRLHGTGNIEALLLHRLGDADYRALVRPGRRFKIGTAVELEGGHIATVTSIDESDGSRTLRFERELPPEAGEIALPPYIHSREFHEDRYQTVYAKSGGSAAAPTAGLHFTPQLLKALRAIGLKTATVTVDIGLDTFRPIDSQTVEHHKIHGETIHLSKQTSDSIARCTGRVVAVGTTSVRAIESAANPGGALQAGSRPTSLFITPGYEFRAVDAIITNFHMPRTTMLAMVCAFAGRDLIIRAYKEAVAERYRFLSFGDSMLLL